MGIVEKRSTFRPIVVTLITVVDFAVRGVFYRKELSGMIRLIKENQKTIEQFCSQYRVLRLELFGSALTNESFDPEKSDLDFLVEFLPLKPGEHADAYFGLLEALQDLFGRHIDLIETKAIRNPYFLESVNRNRREIYAA